MIDPLLEICKLNAVDPLTDRYAMASLAHRADALGS